MLFPCIRVENKKIVMHERWISKRSKWHIIFSDHIFIQKFIWYMNISEIVLKQTSEWKLRNIIWKSLFKFKKTYVQNFVNSVHYNFTQQLYKDYIGPWEMEGEFTSTPIITKICCSCNIEFFRFNKKWNVLSNMWHSISVRTEMKFFKRVKYSSCSLIWYRAQLKLEKSLLSITLVEKNTTIIRSIMHNENNKKFDQFQKHFIT